MAHDQQQPVFHGYPSIGRFDEVVAQVNGPHHAPDVSKVLRFRGTVKLHGTHGDVVGTTRGTCSPVTLHAQSRNRVLTVDSDNMGFAAFVGGRDAVFRDIVAALVLGDRGRQDRGRGGVVVLAGELCGGNVQANGIGMARLPRMFVIVGVQIDGRWRDMATLPTLPEAPEHGVHNVLRFPTWELCVDCADPHAVEACAAEMGRLCLEVERACPVCAQLAGIQDGMGEGIVWTPTNDCHSSSWRYWCKTKGQEHRRPAPWLPQTSSKAAQGKTTVAGLSSETLAYVEQCAEARCLQGVEYLREMVPGCGDGVVGKQHMQAFIRWVGQDVWKEEGERVLAPLGVTETLARRLAAARAAKWFGVFVASQDVERVSR